MTVYFGERWDAPTVDPDSGARRINTPVGEPCAGCAELIIESDQGLEIPHLAVDKKSGEVQQAGSQYWHMECNMLNTIGHYHGVCTCTGFDTSSRSSALVLLVRINEVRAGQGMGPL